MSALQDGALLRTTRLRDGTGWAAMLLYVLFFLALIDALLAGALPAPNTYRMAVGDTLPLNGALPEYVPSIAPLRARSSDPRLELHFEAIQKEFWLGLPMWRGRLVAAPGLPPGDYRIEVSLALPGVSGTSPAPAESPIPEDPSPAPSSESTTPGTLAVRVFPDAEALRRSDPSWAVRHLALEPGWIALGVAPLMLMATGGVFLLSRRRASMLARLGLAEIHRVESTETGTRIWFGLGSIHGLEVGRRVMVLDAAGLPIGEAEVSEVTDGNAQGRMVSGTGGSAATSTGGAGRLIRPGDLVRVGMR